MRVANPSSFDVSVHLGERKFLLKSGKVSIMKLEEERSVLKAAIKGKNGAAKLIAHRLVMLGSSQRGSVYFHNRGSDQKKPIRCVFGIEVQAPQALVHQDQQARSDTEKGSLRTP